MSRLTIRHGPRAVPVWMGPLDDPPPVGLHGPASRGPSRARSSRWSASASTRSCGPSWRRSSTASSRAAASRAGRRACLPTLVGGVAHAARAAGVRPYAESVRAALDYALTSTDALAGTQDGDVELWSVKDGRRASVWRVRSWATG